MIVLRSLDPLQNSSGCRLVVGVNELPIAGELCSRHPLKHRLRQGSLSFGLGQNQGDCLMRGTIKYALAFLSGLRFGRAWYRTTITRYVPWRTERVLNNGARYEMRKIILSVVGVTKAGRYGSG